MIVRAAAHGVVGHGLDVGVLDNDAFARRLGAGLAAMPLDGQRVLVIVPDGTRTMPMAETAAVLEGQLLPRVAALDYLVALGTHPPMTDAQLTRHFGRPVCAGAMGASRVFNHEWQRPDTFVTLGRLPAAETAALTGGRLSRDVVVSLNRRILDYDHLLVCGPVFPHEVVGFSGGSKYFFPGIGGQEIIDVTHWLGALITNYEVIGTPDTPVRAVIDRAAAMIAQPISCCALVVTHAGVAGVYCGPLQAAWRAAAALSARRHVVYVDRPFRQVLSVMPAMYDDLWTAAKGMYKVEPAVADGGEVIIYAPHIDEVSYTHGRLIDEIGYHCRDYFTAQWDRFAGYPGGVLAHSTHLKGLGTYDAGTGVETPRVRVTLATGIPEARCRQINLGYLDPARIDLDAWRGREDEGILLIPRAGEMLYRVRRG
jgi:nickel-dependent lactate racemase